MDQLLDPPFARNPAFRADAKIVGIVLAVLAAIALLFGLIGLPIVLALGVFAPLLALSLIASLVGAALTVYGGWKMFQLQADGKRWVVYGLIAYAIGSLLTLLSGDFGSIISLAICGIVYYVVVTSRFGTEPGGMTTT